MAKTKPGVEPKGARVLTKGMNLLPAAAASLLVARPLVTSDGAAGEGDGAVFVMLWIVLAAGWLLGQLRQGKLSFRFGWTDTALMLLIVWYAVSALVAVAEGSPRAAISPTWEWVGLGLSFVLVRQCFAAAWQARALVAAMIGLSVALAAVGLHQYYVTAPETRARYEEIKDDPQAMLSEVGEWFPPGSPERKRFENRLASTEPSATFALANSLAGYLAPWLIMILAVAALPRPGATASNVRTWLLAALLATPVAGCLLLTKSRSALVAVAIGLGWLWAVSRLERGAMRARFLWGAVAGFVLLAAIAVQTGALDREVVSEAGKSLGYRLQYWRSTLSMIRDEPLMGVGPGQFQDRYPAYKLPEASEEIRDPHNFLLEVGSSAGLPSLLLLLAALVAFTWRIFVTRGRSKAAAESHGTLLILGGAAAGVFLAQAVGALVGFAMRGDVLLLTLVVLPLAMLLLRGWVRHGTLTASVCWIGVAVLLVNLLAAGGISEPGVAGSLWVLMALGLNLADAGRAPRSYSIHTAWLATAGAVLLAVLCYVTEYRPVLNSRGLVSRSYSPAMLRDPVGRAELLAEAQSRDPQSADIARLLAAQRFALWQDNDSPQSRALLEAATAEVLRLAPSSSTTWRQAADWNLQIFRQTGEAARLQAALDQYARAVELYPTSAAQRAAYAEALLAAEQPEAAATEAAEALRLDAITRQAGHLDRLLADEQRAALLRIEKVIAN